MVHAEGNAVRLFSFTSNTLRFRAVPKESGMAPAFPCTAHFNFRSLFSVVNLDATEVCLQIHHTLKKQMPISEREEQSLFYTATDESKTPAVARSLD